MSSAKRRKIEEDDTSAPSSGIETKKIKKPAAPALAAASASPEPATQASKETTVTDAQPEKDVPVQKTFKDLVRYSFG